MSGLEETEKAENAQQAANLEHKAREYAREKLVRSGLYKGVAGAFVVAAIFIVFFLYQIVSDGKPMNIIERPFVIVLLLLPFVPAYFLAMLSKKSRRDAMKALEPHYDKMVQRLRDED